MLVGYCTAKKSNESEDIYRSFRFTSHIYTYFCNHKSSHSQIWLIAIGCNEDLSITAYGSFSWRESKGGGVLNYLNKWFNYNYTSAHILMIV